MIRQRKNLLQRTGLGPTVGVEHPTTSQMPTPEALAREQTDTQLNACGRLVQDFKSVDFSAGRGIALREVRLTTGPCDFFNS